MKKYIVLSVNDNPDYLFHVPLTVWAWRYFGWDYIMFYNGMETEVFKYVFDYSWDGAFVNQYEELYNIPGYKSETIAQVSRLYGSCVVDGYIMTGDIDMIPLSDYWQPDFNKLTVWGRDLTDYHYPICYIGAPTPIWRELMTITGEWTYDSKNYNAMIKRDLRQQKNMWTLDQDLITERINSSGYIPTRIDRGTDKRTGYPVGRIDRSHWTLEHKQYIDCHMYHGIQNDENKFRVTLAMLHHIWPKEDWSWWINYYKEFKKLCQNTQFAH